MYDLSRESQATFAQLIDKKLEKLKETAATKEPPEHDVVNVCPPNAQRNVQPGTSAVVPFVE